MPEHRHQNPAEDPAEKSVADAIESVIGKARSIEEEMLLEAAELEEMEFRGESTD